MKNEIHASPIEAELNAHFQGIDREESFRDWRDRQLAAITDYRRHFDGDMDEFVWLMREGLYEPAQEILKRADETYIRTLLDQAGD